MSSSSRLAPAPAPRGVLGGGAPEESREHQRFLPPATLADYVAHFWSVRWSVSEPKLAETLPHPTVHVVFEQSTSRGQVAEIAGVPRGRFSRQLSGAGSVFGVKFRPAMFQPLLNASMSSLTGRVLSLDELFGVDALGLAKAVFSSPQIEARCAVLEAFLLQRLARIPASAFEAACAVRDLVERMASDQTLLRAESAATLLAVDVRTLQRRFRAYVGVSPKWVILRYRLHEAAERLKARKLESLAALANELGYADQAHFARDFTKWVGQTPSAFLTRERDVR